MNITVRQSKRMEDTSKKARDQETKEERERKRWEK
jgi:hypothetical protein